MHSIQTFKPILRLNRMLVPEVRICFTVSVSKHPHAVGNVSTKRSSSTFQGIQGTYNDCFLSSIRSKLRSKSSPDLLLTWSCQECILHITCTCLVFKVIEGHYCEHNADCIMRYNTCICQHSRCFSHMATSNQRSLSSESIQFNLKYHVTIHALVC